MACADLDSRQREPSGLSSIVSPEVVKSESPLCPAMSLSFTSFVFSAVIGVSATLETHEVIPLQAHLSANANGYEQSSLFVLVGIVTESRHPVEVSVTHEALKSQIGLERASV